MILRPTALAAVLLAAVLLAASWAAPGFAQELEPRFFSQVPVGMNFAGLSAQYNQGGMSFDHATTIEDASGEIRGVGAGYVRTLNFLGASAKATVTAPYLWGDWRGTYRGAPAATSREGFGDPAAELSVNFLGAPALAMREMRAYRQKWVAGASVKAIVPLGQYDPDKLLNLGANRWAFRFRLGASHKSTRLTVEAMTSVWIFTDNDDFFGGNTLEQDPLWSAQLNAIYEFPSRIWFGLGAGLSRGGQAKPNGVATDTYRKNTRWGAILSYPVGQRHSVRAVYISELYTRIGADFDQWSLGWTYRWGGGI